MLFAEYIDLSAAGVELGIDSSLTVGSFNLGCAVDGWVALNVSYTSPRFERNEIHEILFSDRPKDKGLCFLLTTADEGYRYTEASSMYVAAFLADASASDHEEIDAGTYRYRKDYVVVFRGLYHRYVSSFKDSSHIWGGFYHDNVPVHSLSKCTQLTAFPGLRLPTAFHQSEASRANSASSALERFLALYHLLELSFDYDLVEEIKALPSDLKRVGKLLASFDHGESSRLLRLVMKYWKDERTLSEALGRAFDSGPFRARFLELLFEYEKDGFPWRFKDDHSKFQLFLTAAATSFTESHFVDKSRKLGWSLENLQKSLAFTIYRFRCAIAHASIGECVLSAADDDFVHTVGEPLLMELLSNVFKR
ncbi:hypothetical protein [Sphaerotilus montanus]|uniref:Apea-like HEPN domain-containing protein n=1 Tax=Sphaerotilus montanus TaxID=522889 RepID=A0A7Y9UBT0_9BURK|nr:hypothetical protein [Sphaerotilus montanus]NYG32849.1 hypothetical protein [Sphaerotilus montanus]